MAGGRTGSRAKKRKNRVAVPLYTPPAKQGLKEVADGKEQAPPAKKAKAGSKNPSAASVAAPVKLPAASATETKPPAEISSGPGEEGAKKKKKKKAKNKAVFTPAVSPNAVIDTTAKIQLAASAPAKTTPGKEAPVKAAPIKTALVKAISTKASSVATKARQVATTHAAASATVSMSKEAAALALAQARKRRFASDTGVLPSKSTVVLSTSGSTKKQKRAPQQLAPAASSHDDDEEKLPALSSPMRAPRGPNPKPSPKPSLKPSAASPKPISSIPEPSATSLEGEELAPSEEPLNANAHSLLASIMDAFESHDGSVSTSEDAVDHSSLPSSPHAESIDHNVSDAPANDHDDNVVSDADDSDVIVLDDSDDEDQDDVEDAAHHDDDDTVTEGSVEMTNDWASEDDKYYEYDDLDPEWTASSSIDAVAGYGSELKEVEDNMDNPATRATSPSDDDELVVKTDSTLQLVLPRPVDDASIQTSPVCSPQKLSPAQPLAFVQDAPRLVASPEKKTTANPRVTPDTITDSTATTTPVPEDASTTWGAAFGTAAPLCSAQIVDCSPLSTWFLSRGQANFIKVSGTSAVHALPAVTGRRSQAAAPSTTTTATDSAFYAALAKNHWRSWYTKQPAPSILDTPLVDVPSPVRAAVENANTLHSTTASTSTQRAKAFDGVMEELRSARDESSAFEKRMIEVLQGKTMTGVDFNDAYRSVLP